MIPYTPGRGVISVPRHERQTRPGPANTGLHVLARQMSEADFQASVIQRADRLQLLSYHTHDSRRSRAGFMDLVIVGPHGGVFWELKTEAGRCRTSSRAGWT